MNTSIGMRAAVSTLLPAIATTALFSLPSRAVIHESTLNEDQAHVHEQHILLAQWIQPDMGESSPGTYYNEYFAFSLAFPRDWAIASQETQEQVMDLGTEIVSEANPEFMEAAAESLEKTYQLLMISAESFGSSELLFNPNLIVMAENISDASHILSGADYLAEHQAILAQTDLPYEMVGDIYTLELDGRTFYRSDYRLNNVINQSYLFTIDHGYAVGYILTGLPEQFQDLETIVASTDFDSF